MSNKKFQAQIKEVQSPQLYKHSLGVAEMAVTLATRLGCDEKKAYLAGLLHDCAREWTEKELLSYINKNGIEADKFSLKYPVLLHAAVGAAYVQEMGIHDNEILAAIRNHTLGYPGMSLLEQITYVADKIEYGRSYPGVEELRNLVEHDFSQGLIAVAEQSISYNLQKKHPLHQITISFWNWLVG